MFKIKGIPYMGSKNKISEDIVKLIKIRNPNAKIFIDIFGGGGSISLQALKLFDKVIYNELNERIYNLFLFFKNNNIPEFWYDWVSREKFLKIINSDLKDAYSGMVETCWSFGNQGSYYMYGKNIERQKELMHKLVVNKSEQAKKQIKQEFNIDIKIPILENIYDRYLKEYKPQIKYREDLQSLESLQRLQSLERLQSLQSLQRLQMLQRLELYNYSYDKFNLSKYNKDEIVVYCDPPYRNTVKYAVGDFDFKKFNNWFENLDCPAYLSEYESNHKEIFYFNKTCSFSATKNKKTKEKIFWNGIK